MKAAFYNIVESGLECRLCPHTCIVKNNSFGVCGVRYNDSGILISKNYGKVSALNFDPIEKKPLYHFYPGKGILSLGSYGCNMSCNFCQNHSISQHRYNKPDHYDRTFTIDEIIERSRSLKDNTGLAYTYNEPIVWFEFMVDLAKRIKKIGQKNVMVSNGYVNRAPLMELLPLIDAFNIDLKAFDNGFYKAQTGAKLENVLETIKLISTANIHLELTMLVIPGLNDDRDTFNRMLDWIVDNCNKNVVLHLSKFFPNYKSNQSITPDKELIELISIATKKLNHVYLGNTYLETGRDTMCPGCSEIIIRRSGYSTDTSGIGPDQKCKNCDLDLGVFIVSGSD